MFVTIRAVCSLLKEWYGVHEFICIGLEAYLRGTHSLLFSFYIYTMTDRRVPNKLAMGREMVREKKFIRGQGFFF